MYCTRRVYSKNCYMGSTHRILLCTNLPMVPFQDFPAGDFSVHEPGFYGIMSLTRKSGACGESRSILSIDATRPGARITPAVQDPLNI
jgi:hypothetical protein